MKDMVEGYKKMMKIMNKPPLSKYTSKHVYRPIDLDDDKDIEQGYKRRGRHCLSSRWNMHDGSR